MFFVSNSHFNQVNTPLKTAWYNVGIQLDILVKITELNMRILT